LLRQIGRLFRHSSPKLSDRTSNASHGAPRDYRLCLCG
jgi:hypothetical protein